MIEAKYLKAAALAVVTDARGTGVRCRGVCAGSELDRGG